MSRAAELLAEVRTQDAALEAAGRLAAEKLMDEDWHQITLLSWVHSHLREFPELTTVHHSPNGGKRAKVTRKGVTYSPEGVRLKRMGTRAGYPDILIDTPMHGWHGLRIELKDMRGNTMSPAQRAWLMVLRERGYWADMAQGWRAARIIILAYLAGEQPDWNWEYKRGARPTLPPLR